MHGFRTIYSVGAEDGAFPATEAVISNRYGNRDSNRDGFRDRIKWTDIGSGYRARILNM